MSNRKYVLIPEDEISDAMLAHPQVINKDWNALKRHLDVGGVVFAVVKYTVDKGVPQPITDYIESSDPTVYSKAGILAVLNA